MPSAMAGMASVLRPTMLHTCGADAPAAGRGPRRSEIPKATSIAGTAMFPSSSMGSATTRGKVTSRTAMSSPAMAPMVMGLLNIRRMLRSNVGRSPRASLSKRAM